jgi:hypothetical protein
LNSGTDQARRVVFVCRAATGESLRSAEALSTLDRIELFCVSENGPANAELFRETIGGVDVHDARQLTIAVGELFRRHGKIDHLVTAQETLLEPVARARAALEVQGMDSETVRRTLDKSLLKATLRRAGVVTPPDKIVTKAADAVRFLSIVGFPIMLKPLTGSGALATLLIRSAADLEQALKLMQPSPAQPVVAEVVVEGQELCLDTITIDNEPQFHSICCYYPSILEALEQPATQWSCVMPRELDGIYADFIQAGLEAVRALSVGNSFTHMEGFVDGDGKPLGFHDATLRPAGARIGPMLGFAYDVDVHRAWARVVVDGGFDGPWERKYGVGTVFLRGQGSGVVQHVTGSETVVNELGSMLVDASWPRVGVKKSETYTGDGYVTVRHENTDEVKEALSFIGEAVRLTYSNPATTESTLQWRERFRNYKELNRPAWEV